MRYTNKVIVQKECIPKSKSNCLNTLDCSLNMILKKSKLFNFPRKLNSEIANYYKINESCTSDLHMSMQ